MEGEEDELVAPGYAFERYALKFASVNETNVEVQINCLERLSLFDAVGLLDGNDCTGLRIWPGARALCGYLAAHPDIVAGKTVLELGAGAGLVGLLSGKLNASKVTITDSSEDSLELLRRNVEQNFPEDNRVTVASLDWHQRSPHRDEYNIIVASDVIYFHELVEPLFRTVLEHFQRKQGQFLLCFSSKGKELNGYVLEVASMLGFISSEISDITTVGSKSTQSSNGNSTNGSFDEEDSLLLAYRFTLQ